MGLCSEVKACVPTLAPFAVLETFWSSLILRHISRIAKNSFPVLIWFDYQIFLQDISPHKKKCSLFLAHRWSCSRHFWYCTATGATWISISPMPLSAVSQSLVPRPLTADPPELLGKNAWFPYTQVWELPPSVGPCHICLCKPREHL